MVLYVISTIILVIVITDMIMFKKLDEFPKKITFWHVFAPYVFYVYIRQIIRLKKKERKF